VLRKPRYEECQMRAPVVRANEGIAGLRPRIAALCYSNSAAAKKSRSLTYDGQRAARAVIVLPQYGKYWRSQCSAAMAHWLRRDRRGADELQRFEDGPCADPWSVCPAQPLWPLPVAYSEPLPYSRTGDVGSSAWLARGSRVVRGRGAYASTRGRRRGGRGRERKRDRE
jgi:hypothetical protein